MVGADSQQYNLTASRNASYDYDQRVTPTVAIISTLVVLSIAMVIILANMLVLVAIFTTSRLGEQAHWLIANLAVSDLGMGGYMLLLFPYQVLGDPGRGYCLFAKYSVNILIMSSYVALLMITVDRFIAITRPLHYQQIVTYTVAKRMIAGGWIYSILLSLSVLINDRYFDGSACSYGLIVGRGAIVFLSVQFFINVIVMLTVYTRVGYIALQHSKRLAPMPTLPEERRQSSDTVKQLRLVKVLFIVVGAFVSCWLPFYVHLLIVNVGLYEDTTGMFRYIVYALLYSSSALNPVIYAWKNRDFRLAFKVVLRKIPCCANCFSEDEEENSASALA